MGVEDPYYLQITSLLGGVKLQNWYAGVTKDSNATFGFSAAPPKPAFFRSLPS